MTVSSRIGRFACALVCASLLIMLLATGAGASSNTGPSNATNVKIGVPFTGTWKGTKSVGDRGYTHWWRLPQAMRPGDQVQLAIDNSSDAEMDFCLVPPVDDFDADEAASNCDSTYIGGGEQERHLLTYEEASGKPFLVVDYDECCEEEPSGTYTITVERQISLVNIGLVIPPAIPANFSLIAYLTYGDNSPAGNGIPAFLQWRFAPSGGSDPSPFENVVTALSAGGLATFTGTMPAVAQGSTVQMRACVAQPGGTDVRCAPSAQTTVEVSTCYRALASRRARTRAVRRTQRHLKRARARHAKRAKRRLKRSLKRKRRKLAKAKRSVQIHCA